VPGDKGTIHKVQDEITREASVRPSEPGTENRPSEVEAERNAVILRKIGEVIKKACKGSP